MKIKQNESTKLRPEGSRIIDAPLVSMDIPAFIKQLRNETVWENADRNAITVFKTNGMRIVLIALHKDAELKKHTADGIISVQVIEGEINFNTDDQSLILKKNQIVGLHKGIPHSVKAIKESVFLLTLTTSLDK